MKTWSLRLALFTSPLSEIKRVVVSATACRTSQISEIKRVVVCTTACRTSQISVIKRVVVGATACRSSHISQIKRVVLLPVTSGFNHCWAFLSGKVKVQVFYIKSEDLTSDFTFYPLVTGPNHSCAISTPRGAYSPAAVSVH